MADLLGNTLIVRQGSDASPHVLRAVGVEVDLDVLLEPVYPAGGPLSVLSVLHYEAA